MSSGLAGSGPTPAFSTVKNSPWKVTFSCRRSSLSSSSDSSNTAPRGPGTGNASRSAGLAGVSPNAGSTRLGASAARDASCLATRTG